MHGNIENLRVYSDKDALFSLDGISMPEVSLEIPLADLDMKNFIRVGIEGMDSHWVCASTPIYLVN